MKVCINGRFLGQRVTGVQRYGRETLLELDRAIAKEPLPFDVEVLYPQGTEQVPLQAIRQRAVGSRRGHAWEQLELPQHARDALLLSFNPTGPLLHKRQIVTVHDAAVIRVPQAYSLAFRLWYRFVVGWLGKRASKVLTVSEFSRHELALCFGMAPANIGVMSEGWQHVRRVPQEESIIDQHGLRGKRFVLAVSSPTPNKNFKAITAAIEELGDDAPLCVIAGASDSSVFKSGALGSNVIRVGYVSDAELAALYAHAYCFIFPSFYEGFGLPPLEAMALGCPVIASTAGALQETCEDAALYFDPHRPEELAQCLRKMFESPTLREHLKAKGLERAAGFSWAQTGRDHLRLIKEMAVA